MKTVDARGLQHHLGRYLDEVERGETLLVRRRRRIIARIAPHEEEGASEPWPDLMERLRQTFPEGPVGESASDLIYRDRGDR